MHDHASEVIFHPDVKKNPNQTMKNIVHTYTILKVKYLKCLAPPTTSAGNEYFKCSMLIAGAS